MEFKCPTCGSTELCFYTFIVRKSPISFENGRFEGAGRVEETDSDMEESPAPIRCGNGHRLELMSDQGYVYNKDDMKYYLAEREQIEESSS